MKRAAIRTGGFLSAIALFSGGPACTPNGLELPGTTGDGSTTLDSPTTGENPADQSASMLALTATDAPVLAALAAKFVRTSADGIATDDFETLKEQVARAGVVVADAAQLSSASESLHAILRAAQAAGVPIVLDNIGDAASMAAALGIGIDPAGNVGVAGPLGTLAGYSGLTALAIPSNNGRDIHLMIFGDSGSREFSSERVEGVEEPPPSEEPLPIPDAPDEEPVEADYLDEDQPSELESGLPDVQATAAVIADVITYPSRDALLAAKLRSVQQGSSPVPDGVAHRRWTVALNPSSAKWKPGGKSQGAFIAIDFLIELFDSAPDPGPDNKYLRITPQGAGASPGGLTWDQDRSRGYYQDRVEVECGPWVADPVGGVIGPGGVIETGTYILPPGWAIHDSGPENANNKNQLASETGFEVGFSSDGVEGTYSASNTITTELMDFAVLNQTDLARGRWDFKMSAIDGRTYNFAKPSAATPPRDSSVQYTGWNVKYRKLPTLAKNLLKPNFQVVFRAPGDFQASVPMRFYMKHTMTRLWIDKVDRLVCAGACFGCVCTFRSNYARHTHRRAEVFTVDFSSVNN